jgi:hypothetical protein
MSEQLSRSSSVRLRLVAASTVAVLVLLAASAPQVLAGGAAASLATVRDAPCDVTIDASTDVINGERFPEVAGGGTICLTPGRRGNLKLRNLHGSPERPVVVRNHGGRVVITGETFEAGITISASTYLRITGTGVASTCGARFEPEDQACGIVIDRSKKGVKVQTSRGEVRGLTLDHIAVLRNVGTKATRGIAVHPVPRQVIDGITIAHNYVSQTGAEAIYIGSEPRDEPWEELGKVDHVEAAYNLIERIGWDGIKLKVALSASTVHHNVIRDVGLAEKRAHRTGITVATSVVDVHHNVIDGAVEGIKSGRGVTHATNVFHHNLVANTTDFAISTTDDNASIHNNTIVEWGVIGIRARGEGTRIVKNLIARSGAPASGCFSEDSCAPETIKDRSDAVRWGNLVVTLDESMFIEPETGQYSLAGTHSAWNVGAVARYDACSDAGIRMRCRTVAGRS